jgi:membrane fusion protein, multidrug efflux system
MNQPETLTSRSPAAPHPSRLRLWLVGFVLLALGATAYWYWGQKTEPAALPSQSFRARFAMGNQPIPVRLAPVRTDTVDVQIRALGTVTPLNTVTVRSRLDGELVRVLFTEGQRVRQGDLLAEIDPRPYQVALTQAQGQLEENKARLTNAQGDLARYEKLAAEGLITGQQVTTQQALVQQYQGALQANEAQVNNARLQLTYTRVIAPIDGRLGLRQVDPGNLVRSTDPNGIVVITQMRPISVLFTVPEADLPAVLEGMRGSKRMVVEAWDRSDHTRLAEGSLQTVDNQIDTATGTIKLRGRFANTDEQLFPNQFVNVRLGVQTLRDATVIPAAAVQRGSFGTFVYVANDNSTVGIRRIQLGPAEGDMVSVASGLKPDERVVLEGVDDLKEGARVQIIGEGPSAPAAGSAAPAGPPPAQQPATGGRGRGRRP